jgi:hypothetical protein
MAESPTFDVMAATIVVEIALRLKRSCCTMSAGRRPRGSDPLPANVSQCHWP